ncbi:MAG TPA: ATP-binding cassette domain-containing protein [Gaiellaceae bacterium]|nr:ATP-binding cassette domain-containing protein [Gaiellaceae bacterium]
MAAGTAHSAGGDLRVVAENIGRRNAESRESLSSAISIWRKLRGETVPLGAGGGDDVGADDDDDDVSGDDDTTVELEDDAETAAGLKGRWLIQDVSFTVRAGEGLGVVGVAGTGAGAVVRVLDRMLHLDKGRISIYGRPSRTATYNITMAQPDAAFREMAQAMALIARVPRKQRRGWVEELLQFALYDEHGTMIQRDVRTLMRRLSVAAQLDPTADVLLIDDLPMDDPAYAARCIARAKDALANGAAAVLAGVDLVVPMIEICSRAIRVENGLVAAEGDPAVQIEIERRRVAAGAAAHASDSHPGGFDARAAILAAHVTPGSGWTRVDLELETATAGVTIEPRLVLHTAGSRLVVLRHRTPMACDRPGRYLLSGTVTLPEELLGSDVDTIVEVRAGGVLSEIGRTSIGTIGAPREGEVIEGADVDLDDDATGSPQVAWELEEVGS